MTARTRIGRGGLAFLGCSLVWIVLTSQLGHRPRLGVELPPLSPGPASPVPSGRQLPVQTSAASVLPLSGSTEPLDAWVTRPVGVGDGPVPGVVLVSGSGATTRDDLTDVAEGLAAEGVASIRYDKRRSGYGPTERDYTQLADDAAAAATALAGRPEVDAERIGAFGFSEGGWVLPLAAQRHPERFAFLVLTSAPVVSPAEQLAWTIDRTLAGAPDSLRRVPPTLLAAGGGVLAYTRTDIRPALGAVRVPAFAIWGAEDPTVPVNEAARRLCLALGSPPRIEVVDGAGHRLPLDSGYLRTVARWILAPPGPEEPPATAQLSGVEPATALGVGELSAPRWYQQAPVHLAVSLLAGLLVALRPTRGRATSAGTDPRSTSHHSLSRELIMLDPSAAITCGIALLAVITIAYGGTFMLKVVTGSAPANDLQKTFFRAGHAHAGVLVILGLVVQIVVQTDGVPGWSRALSDGVLWAAILMSAGFFLSVIGRDPQKPNRLIALLWIGAAALTVGLGAAGAGLIVAGTS